MLTGILLANGNISASILNSLFNENLVKEGEEDLLQKVFVSGPFYLSLTECPCLALRSVCSLRCQALQVVDQREGHQLRGCQPAQSGHGQPADGESISHSSFPRTFFTPLFLNVAFCIISPGAFPCQQTEL